MTEDAVSSIRTLRLKVKSEAYAWLGAAAIEVNTVWNFANETSYRAARPFAGPSRWLSAFDLDKLTAGACECFERIGSGTIQRVNAEYATRRGQFNRAKLRWRRSYGSRRSLGWVPFKPEQLLRKGEAARFYRNIEQKIAQAQRRGHKRQAKRLHRTAARRRRDALHKFSILSAERCPPSIRGNESPWSVREPSQPYWRDAGIPALTAAA